MLDSARYRVVHYDRNVRKFTVSDHATLDEAVYAIRATDHMATRQVGSDDSEPEFLGSGKYDFYVVKRYVVKEEPESD